jgi:hypothetical protein
LLEAPSRRVFLDIDPGFGQMWKALGLHDLFAGHDTFATVSQNLGGPDCSIPTCGFHWISTPPPVVLNHWPYTEGNSGFTSIGSWRGPYGPIKYQGRTYGLRVHEFRKFARLPQLTQQRFEAALDIDPADQRDINLLREHSWALVNPARIVADPRQYRGYIQRSTAELMIAKGMYVASNSGWFSDRSACYLASGKPVLAQDTGFAQNYPVGEGLIPFSDLSEAVAGVETIRTDLRRQRAGARALAEEIFDARKALTRLLDEIYAARPTPAGVGADRVTTMSQSSSPETVTSDPLLRP